ncbi:MAG: YceH family protein [bacterium]|nr:YceH family protein [bacterium]
MERLDRTEQRIVGVLIEKQLAVPDSYPLSENALVAGCNQSSNRDPVMELRSFEISGALMALHEKEWVGRVEGGGRVARYRHRTEERTGVEARFLPLLCELLVRGPQAPGALKPRVARLGWTATPAEIEAALQELAALPRPLAERQPKRPRERDHRWRHLLGDGSEVGAGEAAESSGAADDVVKPAPVAAPATGSASIESALGGSAAGEHGAELADRVQRLEERVDELQRLVDVLRSSSGID